MMRDSRLRWAVTVLLVALCTSVACAAEPFAQTQPANTNHLAGQRSPYLLQHAHNPVNWYPWGTEAFARARAENKPIFLSIGYSTCHWCHVMERESFEDPEVAKLINASFIAIKVDREERPDVDAVYMQFITALTGEGGWPMTVFLTPDLKPFFGGTYFPPEDRDGMPGLKRVLPGVSSAWRDKHDKVLNSANELARKLRDATVVVHSGQLDPQALENAFEAFGGEFDVHHGGFGDAPRFPRPVVLSFLLSYHRATGQQRALDMSLQTLRAMAQGGLHDQLGGGFHRYSTDERWFLPHFEKMLYDQAQLAGSYLDAFQITHDPLYAAAARDIFDYVLRDLTGPDGQFYCAEDADSAPDSAHPQSRREGAFYVWRADEIRTVLGNDQAGPFNFRFGLENGGNVERDPRGEFKDQNVLFQAHSLAETARQFGKTEAEMQSALEIDRTKLLDVRAHRPRPARDDKALAGWNGLMISALARGGAILNEPRYSEAASRAARFVQEHLYDAAPRRLTRRWRDGAADVPGFLDDYTFFIRGLLDLYQSNFDVRWLKLAVQLQGVQDELFWDARAGGYFQSAGDDPSVLIRLKQDEDSAEPAGNSVAALNLLRLGRLLDDRAMTDRAGKTLDAFASQMNRAPTSMPLMLVAHQFHLHKPRQVVVAGKIGSPETGALLKEISARYLPETIILLADRGEGQQYLAEHLPALRNMGMVGNHAAAYVCENYACQLPITDSAKLGELLDALPASATTRPSGP